MQLQGQIVYKDGTIEPILAYTEREYECEVTTESGKYLYQPYVIEAPNGLILGDYRFYQYDYRRQEWYEANNIKEFQFKENKNENKSK